MCGFIRIVEVMEEIVAGFTREALVLQTAENNISETFQSQSRSIAYTAFKVCTIH